MQPIYLVILEQLVLKVHLSTYWITFNAVLQNIKP